VLELSDQLGLSAEQKARVQSLFDSMKAEAVPLGERLLEQEAALDQQFASRSVTPERLKVATAAIGVTQGKLRETHLKYHLVAHCDIPRKPMSFAAGLGHYHINSGKSSARFSFINDKPLNGEMIDDDEIESAEIERVASHLDMDEAFRVRMLAAIIEGLENAPIGVVTTPGTKNPKFVPTERLPRVSSQRDVEHA